MESILIIDDDVSLCVMLRDYFAMQNVSLSMSHHGISGLEEARRGTYDLILLDVMLPGIDGFEVLHRLRAVSNVSVLLLTSRGEAADRIMGLENGADDYVPKPFNPRELLARIRAILRRSNGAVATPSSERKKTLLYGFELHAASRSAYYHGSPLLLSDIEYVLLETLLHSAGVVLSREHLVDRIFQRPFNPMDRSLDMLVSRLRRKLELDDNPGMAIRTIRSSGYLFAVPLRS